MIDKAHPRNFGHHALAVLGATIIGSTMFSLIWMIALMVSAGGRLPGLTWLVTVAFLFWIGVFVITLPGAGFVFSVLWPMTRRRTKTTKFLCVLAGATTGIILAPLMTPDFQGATALQLALFAAAGAAIAGLYLRILVGSSRTPARPD